MPYKLQETPQGFFVVNKATGKRMSKKALPRKRAVMQLRALYASEAQATKEHTGVVVALMLPLDIAKTLAIANGEPPEDMHITLAYLGKIDNVDMGRVAAAVGMAVEGLGEVKGKIGGVGRFVDTGDPEGDALYLSYDSPDILKLREHLEYSFSVFGVTRASNHGFTPHITLAYIPPESAMPDIQVKPQELNFDTVTLCYGDTRLPFALNGPDEATKEVSATPTAALGHGGPGGLFSSPGLAQTIASTVLAHASKRKRKKVKELDLTPPQAVQDAAKMGLALRKKYGRGGLSTQEAGAQGIGSGMARAVSLSRGQAQSPDTIRRMVAFFNRHEGNKATPPEEGNGKIAWLLWGGDPGRAWAEKMLSQIEGKELALKHAPGQHNQKRHGWRYGNLDVARQAMRAGISEDYRGKTTPEAERAGYRKRAGLPEPKKIERKPEVAPKAQPKAIPEKGLKKPKAKPKKLEAVETKPVTPESVKPQKTDFSNWKQEEYEIAVPNGMKKVTGYRKGDYGFQENTPGKYSITHIPSGYSIGWARTQRGAKYLSSLIERHIGSFSKSQFEQIMPTLKSIAKEFGFTGDYGQAVRVMLSGGIDKLLETKKELDDYSKPHPAYLDGPMADHDKTGNGLYVFKEDSGNYRWVTFSSNPYQDRDREFVSWKSLKDDVARADSEGDYGPLRWWHVPRVDIGKCDFNMLHGKILIESGTFNDPAIAQTVKENADKLEISIGFTHPPDEPDGEGVYHTIRRFERSLCPKGRVSNRFTRLVVA